MAFMSLALAMVLIALFILNLLRTLGAVLLAGGCSARSKGHPVLATGLQCIGVILLIPVLLSMASIPVFFIISMLQ